MGLLLVAFARFACGDGSVFWAPPELACVPASTSFVGPVASPGACWLGSQVEFAGIPRAWRPGRRPSLQGSRGRGGRGRRPSLQGSRGGVGRDRRSSLYGSCGRVGEGRRSSLYGSRGRVGEGRRSSLSRRGWGTQAHGRSICRAVQQGNAKARGRREPSLSGGRWLLRSADACGAAKGASGGRSACPLRSLGRCHGRGQLALYRR